MDVVPQELRETLNQANVAVTNFHTFLLHEKVAAGKLTKSLLAGRKDQAQSPFTETPDQMVRRVCRDFGTKRNIVVINDEAHHCYRRKPPEEVDEAAGGVLVDKLAGDDRKEAQDREEEARVWISGLEAIKAKIGVRAIYDLSATPFFLRGSGYPEGTLFPWVVSDFSLIDAIECGIVKVPRVPVADDCHDRRPAHLPRALAAHPRRAAQEGPQDRGRDRRRAARAAGTSWRARSTASTATTRSRTRSGSRCATRRSPPATAPTPPTSRRRSSSWSATTPTSASSSTTGSRVGRSPCPTA